ncbi:MAG: hypothetical protein C4576_26920 [Desulfobacteraceae bacterium]|nr:MAG: hypothetical protein C4576_26920 [Desulfobacteraceae bacterium]
MNFIRFILIVAGFVLVFTCRPFLHMAIGGAVVFVIIKTKEKKGNDKASEASKKADDTEVPPR